MQGALCSISLAAARATPPPALGCQLLPCPAPTALPPFPYCPAHAGPFLGALAAVPFHFFFNMRWDTKKGGDDPLAVRSSSYSDVERGQVSRRRQVVPQSCTHMHACYQPHGCSSTSAQRICGRSGQLACCPPQAREPASFYSADSSSPKPPARA